MTVRTHEISASMLDRLAQGKPDPAAIQALGAAQISKRLLLIKYLVEAWPLSTAARDSAIAALAEAQHRDEATVASLLSEPHTGSWVTQTVRQLRNRTPPTEVSLGYLGALGAAAAARTGLDTKLTIHTHHGLAAIPTFGAARLRSPDQTPVQVTVVEGVIRVTGAGQTIEAPDDPITAEPNWLPLRRLSAGAGDWRFAVVLDDLDPFRNSYHIPAAGRLADSEVARWNDLFDGAWWLLTSLAPGHASELAAGLRTMVPLAADTGPARSATVRDAFGSFGLTPPDSPTELAIAMVHEFQHSKLSALLDLIPLHEPSGPETYFAPWRRDPRPLGGLFQGVYAFLAIADLWCSLREEPTIRLVAERGLARIREQVSAGLSELTSSGKLTLTGERFVAGMRARLDALFAVPVPVEVATAAREALRRDHEEWQRRNARSN